MKTAKVSKEESEKIQEKDIITIDMGCKIDGYCSDMTRTFFVGEIPEEMKKVYNYLRKKDFNVFYYPKVDDVDPEILKNKSVYLKASNGVGLSKLIPKKEA